MWTRVKSIVIFSNSRNLAAVAAPSRVHNKKYLLKKKQEALKIKKL